VSVCTHVRALQKYRIGYKKCTVNDSIGFICTSGFYKRACFSAGGKETTFT
jgi:hypothetical protein